MQLPAVDQRSSSLMLTALLIGALFPIRDYRLSWRKVHGPRLHQQQKQCKSRLEARRDQIVTA